MGRKITPDSLPARRLEAMEALALHLLESGGVQADPNEWVTGQSSYPIPGLFGEMTEEISERQNAWKYGIRSTYDPPPSPQMLVLKAYLGGIITTDAKGVDVHNYCGLNVERAGRILLSKLLESDCSLPRDIRMNMVWLFDPNRRLAPYQCEREFTLKHRKVGGKAKPIFEVQVIEYLIQKTKIEKEKHDYAVLMAMEKFGVGKTAINDIWSKHPHLHTRRKKHPT